MLFMINGGFGVTNSGIESAQIDRLKIFEEHHYPAISLTVNWFPGLHTFIKDLGIRQDQILNIFDYFCGTTDASYPRTVMSEITVPEGYVKDEAASTDTYWQFKKDGKIRLEIWSVKGSNQVRDVTYRNVNHQSVITDTYDYRGFRSSRSYIWLKDRKLLSAKRVFYTVDGEEKIEIEYGSSTFEKDTAVSVKLHHYKGQEYWFKSEFDFRTFFFDEVNRDHGLYNAFLSDRGLLTDWAVLNMKTPAYKTMYIHSTLVSDHTQPTSRLLNYNYEYALQWPELWTNILASTQFQVDQTLERYGDKIKRIYKVPVGVISKAVLDLPKVKMAEREPHSVITLARLGYEKLIHLQIRGVAEALKTIPDIKFHIYGEGVKRAELEKLTEDLGVGDHVIFEGWTHDKPKAFLDKQVYVSTSNTEAFGISMMEAISFGLPLLTTPVESANDLMVDGKSGFLLANANFTPDQTVHDLAQRLIQLFRDPRLLQQMSDAAYEHRLNFDSEHVWNDWKPWREDAENKKLTAGQPSSEKSEEE